MALRKFLAAAGLVLAAAPALAQSQADIQKLDDQWAAAFNKGDAAAVGAMYTDDAILLPPGGEMVKGRAAIQQAWQKVMQDLTDAKLTNLQFKVLGDGTGYEIGRAAAKTKAQPPKEISGKYVVIWQRVGSEWKVAVDIYNFDK